MDLGPIVGAGGCESMNCNSGIRRRVVSQNKRIGEESDQEELVRCSILAQDDGSVVVAD